MFEVQRNYETELPGNDNNIDKKTLALLAEVGETVNEVPEIFKFWSLDPKPSSIKNAEKYAEIYGAGAVYPEGDACLEELADMLHFIVSIGLELNINPEELYVPYVDGEDQVRNILLFSMSAINLYTTFVLAEAENANINTWDGNHQYGMLLGSFNCIVRNLGYTSEEVEHEFFAKNEVNKERIHNAY